MIKQPNLWTCYPVCLSIITGASLDRIFELVGHDGSKELPIESPWNQEAFVYSEMALAALKLGWFLACIDAGPANEGLPGFRTAWPKIDALLEWIHARFDCILCVQKAGRLHSVAWRKGDESPTDPAWDAADQWDWSAFPVLHIDVMGKLSLKE